jgi:hypothetical protein
MAKFVTGGNLVVDSTQIGAVSYETDTCANALANCISQLNTINPNAVVINVSYYVRTYAIGLSWNEEGSLDSGSGAYTGYDYGSLDGASYANGCILTYYI